MISNMFLCKYLSNISNKNKYVEKHKKESKCYKLKVHPDKCMFLMSGRISSNDLNTLHVNSKCNHILPYKAKTR